MADRPQAEPVVRAASLGRRFGRHWVLSHLDFEVMPGELVWLKGPNGAGKSTLLRLIAGLLTPNHGRLDVMGQPMPRARRSVASSVSSISHALYLYSGLTARESLTLWSKLCAGRQRAAALHDELLSEVGLLEAADRPVNGFSAGMRKRLAFARVRLEGPELLLLDEPFASLDAAGCELVEKWIRRFVGDGGTVLFASHQTERALAMSPRVLSLVDGQLAEQD